MTNTFGSPRHDDIRRKAQAASDKATHSVYVNQCEELSQEFTRIINALNDGQTIIIRDQWGDTVRAVIAQEGER